MKFIKDAQSDTACVYLDLEDTKLPNIASGADIEPLLHFDTDTYNNLKTTKSEDLFNNTFLYPNMFLNSLPEELKVIFAMSIITMHHDIVCTINTDNINLDDPFAASANNTKMYELEERLANTIRELDDVNGLNLYNRVQDFTNEYISLIEVDGIGERPQDSDEMTFYPADQRVLAAMFVICKLFAVISGTFIERCKSIDMDRSLISNHCLTMFKYILRKDDERIRIYNKLYNYIQRTVASCLKGKPEKEANRIYNGDIADTIVDKTMAEIFTRKAIIVNLAKPDTNIMIYINTSAQAQANNGNKGNTANTCIRYRSTPDENMYTDSEEGNDSILEIESANTSCTADINVIISFAITDIVKRYTKRYGFNEEDINSSIAYYSEINHISLNPINTYLISILFGNDLMGARSVELLTSKDLAVLTTIMQLYFIDHGYLDLVHLVALVPTGGIKGTLTGSESKLRSAYMNNHAYRACAEKFLFSINDVSWNTSLAELIKNVTTNRYTINTAVTIWSTMDQEPANGYEYIAPDTLGESICRLILECTK